MSQQQLNDNDTSNLQPQGLVAPDDAQLPAADDEAVNDRLTGVLNRAAFLRQLDQLLHDNPTSQHTLMLLNIDGFQRLNEVFSYSAGDQALVDLAKSLRSMLRHGDLLGRLEGDEFAICLRDVPYEAVVEKKARQIQDLARKVYSTEVRLTVSIGVAVFPRDGEERETLCRSAKAALYSVKAAGRDSFAFFNRLDANRSAMEGQLAGPVVKRRMLIVDDSEVNRSILVNIFKDEFTVETAADGAGAMLLLGQFGASLSVVLLDLVMPGMDGFSVLERMRGNLEMKSIPVIVVSGQDEREAGLSAIRAGATDYISKPVDPELIRLRVESAISKADSERLRAQNSYLLLQSSEEAKYRTVLDSTGTVVIEYDWQGGVFTYDPSITEQLAGHYDGRQLWQALLADQVAEAEDVQSMQELARSVAEQRERRDGSMMVRLKTPAGQREWFRMRVFKRANQFQLTDKMILTFINVNEEVLADELLRYQAERDELTGLYNRKTFFERAAALIAAHPPGYYVMACFDIDNFKVINDQYGSEKGDQVLKLVADLFADGFGAVGGVVCRIMADNFAVLYPVSFMGTPELAELDRAASVLDGSLPAINFRIGRYIIDDLSLPVHAMFDRASLAEASIKGRYGAKVALYDESMRQRLLRRQEIVSEMKPALEQGQFEVWIQPQYNHATGALIGGEALCRWRHPRRGLVSPGEFIPVFERNGFVYELDKFVWEQSCQLLRKWLDQGRSPLPVSVNISRYDLFRSDLTAVITGLIAKYDIPPDLLRLEITESAFSKSPERIISVVKELISYGFTVEIDDFGSGYSSLNTLKDVPAQVIKLDIRFFEDTFRATDDSGGDSSARGGNIIESVVRMAKWLGMAVIAEGVEEPEQADYLKSIGCNYVQGFLYARPMPMAEYEALALKAGQEGKLLTMETVENLDNNAFWDPKSMDTLIFNTYVGGACIFEWSNDRIEILRANDKYAKTIGNENCTAQDALDLVWEEHMDEEAARATRQAIQHAIDSGEEATYEASYFNLFGSSEKVHLRTTFRVIARAAGRYLLYATNENLTAQRRAEQKERILLQQLQVIMDQVNCGVTAVAVDDGAVDFLFSNDRYYQLLGYTRQQYLAEVANNLDPIHPEDRQRVLAATKQISASGQPLVLEYRVRRRDGKQIWQRNSISVASLEGVDVPVLLGVTTDITQDREAQRQISVLNDNLQEMMNDTPGGFARLRVLDGGAVATEYINESISRLLGYDSRQQLAESLSGVSDMIHPDDLDQVRASLAEMVASGETRNLKYRIRHANGEYIPFNVFGRVTQNEAGETFINTYFADMSAEEKQQLYAREAVPYILSAIMDYSTDIAFAKDKDFRYLCCSPAFVRMAGQQSSDQVLGKTDYDLFSPEVAYRFRCDDEQLFATGEPLVDYVEPIPSNDNIQHYCSTSKYLLRDAAGEVIGMYGIGRDITETRTAFEQLRLLTDSIRGGLATYVLTPQGLQLSYFNDGLCRMLGCTREEYQQVTQDGVIAAVFEEDIPLLKAQVERMINEGVPVDCTYRAHNLKGEGYKWIHISVSPAERHGDRLIANAVLFDVTEQKLAEEAARVHEEEMRLAMSQLGKMICEYDPATRTLTVPDAYAALYNVPAAIPDVPESLIRSQVIAEDTLPEYRAFYDAILRGETSGSAEYRDRRPDGNYHWERAEFFTIFDSSGQPVKAIIAVEDTTEQHRRYELEQNRPMLGEANLLIHALFNLNSGETLDYTYQDGRPVPPDERCAFNYVDKGAAQRIVDPRDWESYRQFNDPEQLWDHYRRGETELSLDYRRLLPNGEVCWVRNMVNMVVEPGGSDVLLFEYCYNIEEDKTKELMYSTLVQENYDYVARVNGKNRRFDLIANTGVQYGMPPRSGEDMNLATRQIVEQYVHPEDQAMVLSNTTVEGISQNLAHQDRYQFVFRLIRPDGELRYKKMTQYYLDREREIIIVAREDVSVFVRTEMQKNEQLSNALAAANQASRAKSQFLSRMSHELRTPMNAIIGLSALCATELDNRQSLADSIGKISVSARFLLSLINDILEMSRIESGRVALSEAPMDFERLVSEVNTIIIAQTKDKGLDYEVMVGSSVEPSYIGDVTKLEQILLNILGNAVKFTPSGGKVSLAIEQPRHSSDRATLRFTVTDTGVGIDESFLPSIFDPFAQESADYNVIAAGTGLGLAIAKNLAEMMNGQITVNSIKNVGTVFTVEVQLGMSPESRDYLDRVSSLRLEELRALVVDDDPLVCYNTESILRTMGVEAQWADSGQQAVEMVEAAHGEEQDFDAIFIDWKMPEMDGIETTRRIRRIVGPEITIVIMTAYDWKEIENEARLAGVDLFLEKPIFRSSLARAFEKLLLPETPAPEASSAADIDLSGKRILLAEDHPLNVEVARRLLEKSGAEVVVAANGLEALELFTTEAEGWFDAILMDIRMPVMDGLTAAKSIRNLKKPGSKTIPIVAMTANAFDEDVELSLTSGMNAHLTKPIEPRMLLAALQRLIKD